MLSKWIRLKNLKNKGIKSHDTVPFWTLERTWNGKERGIKKERNFIRTEKGQYIMFVHFFWQGQDPEQQLNSKLNPDLN